jgi:LacI family transcriptional regulator
VPVVTLALDVSSAAGRCFLAGAAQYNSENDHWTLRLVPPSHRAGEALLNGKAKPSDGVILGFADEELVGSLTAKSVPVVVLDHGASRMNCAGVACDDNAIGRMGAHHLLEIGLSRFAFLGYADHTESKLRYQGFCTALREAVLDGGLQPGQVVHYFQCEPETDEPLDQTELEQWVTRLPSPVGIMASDDMLALRLLEASQKTSRLVPDDLAILGVNDDEVVRNLASPSLSTVVPNWVNVGYEAASLLARLMAGDGSARTSVLVPPVRVVERLSTSLMAVKDEVVAEGMQFIRRHACEGITVADVAYAMAVSRSVLQRRFQRAIGRTVHDMIRKERIERARVLLVSTKLPRHEIAVRAGFKHDEHFSRAFKKQVGMTMAEYRELYGTRVEMENGSSAGPEEPTRLHDRSYDR